MATDEILTVHVVRGVPGDRWVTCPHCKEVLYLQSGPVRGEQFQHRILRMNGPDGGCGGWFFVDPDAKLTNQE